MKVYHRTNAADAILKQGFRDGRGTYLTQHVWKGVWLSDEPLDSNEGAFGDKLLVIDIPESELVQWEWVEEGKGYREFLVPASIVNLYGPAKVKRKK
jgi:hypothetical protein